MAKIRVLIADDHAILRAGLRMLINAQPDMEAVAEAGDGQEAVRKAREMAPHVVTMDLSMPGGSGIQKIEKIRQECPQTRVLVLTMHDDLAYVRAAMAAGSSGYLLKSAADDEVLAAIRAVHRGRTVMGVVSSEDVHPEVRPKIPANPDSAGGSAGLLSPRELEVLELLAQGHTNQEVGDQLALSVKTIETYRARIATKLGLKKRADLVRYAVEMGLLSLGKSPAKKPS